jgi:hypothetical protein
MPVARIITRVPEESTQLVARLRARGYTVELVDPGDFRVTPADFEINLDRMKTPDALAAAARFGREHDAEVFVAAGIPLDEVALRAAKSAVAERGNAVVDGFKRLIAPFRRAGAEAHAIRAAKRQRALDIELAREADRQQRAEQKAAERAERERKEATVRAERERQEAAARTEREQRRKEEEQRNREEAERQAIVLARQREEQARRKEEEDRQRVEREAVLARQREEEERGRAEREAVLARQREEERRSREEERVRQEEATRVAAEHAAVLAERQRAEMEARRQRDEQLRRDQAAAALAADDAGVAASEAVPTPAPVAMKAELSRAPRPRPASHRQAPREPESSRVMKRSFAAAAGIAVLAAIGWGAYENRTPASPLSNAERVRGSAIQQEVPFGAASINAQKQAQRAQTTVRPPAAQTAPRTQATAAQPAQAKSSAAKPAASKPAASTPKRARRFANNDVDMIAEDEVVYHGASKKSSNRAAAQQQPQQNGVKKISDMGDN